MAYNEKRTEHSGPKQGCGAFYGPKAEAKKASNRRRRQDDKEAVLSELKFTAAADTIAAILNEERGIMGGHDDPPGDVF